MQDDCKRQDFWTSLLLTEIRLEVYCMLKDSQLYHDKSGYRLQKYSLYYRHGSVESANVQSL